LLYALPSDPAAIVAGPSNSVTPQELQQLRHQLGIDRPLVDQYFSKLGAALHGDFGRSIQTGESVSSVIRNALPATAAMAGLGLVLGVLLGGGIANEATLTRRRWLTQTLMSLPPLAVAIPGFLIGLLLLQWFSFTWHVFPAIGNTGWKSLALPAVTISLQPAAMIAQILTKSLHNELRQPYVDTARSKGAGPVRVNIRHALRNAALPALTIAGVLVGGLLAGAIVVEVVFSRSGLGQISQQAVSTEDFPVIQGMVLLGSLIFVCINLIVDLLYPLLDPRLAQQRRTPRRIAVGPA
jgi:peptide/nickel transport system permease protein